MAKAELVPNLPPPPPPQEVALTLSLDEARTVLGLTYNYGTSESSRAVHKALLEVLPYAK